MATKCEAPMLFMVIERFKGRDPAPVYARLREQGRALPDGLRYVDSWVEANFDRCFQLMECDDATLLQRWVLQWRDLVEFEVVPVPGGPGAVRRGGPDERDSRRAGLTSWATLKAAGVRCRRSPRGGGGTAGWAAGVRVRGRAV